MSVDVRPATADDVDGIVDLLYGHMSQKLSPERWRNILDYPWRPADADRGHVAVDGTRVVGFLGLVYADRPIAGRTERFCNICAWYLLKDYRGQGIGQRIQFGSVSDPAMTYTIMTATAATGRAFGTNSGFSMLDNSRYLLRRRAGGADLDVIEDVDAIAPRLSPADRTILEDHRPYNLRHLLVTAGDARCYVIMQVKRKGDDIDYHEIMYASDHAFLGRHAQALADTILTGDRSVLAIDRRFVPGNPAWESESIRLPRWYRSPTVPPQAIDHLYGEVALLDLKLP